MTRRTVFGTTITLLAALALAGCGGSDDSDSGSDSAGGSAADLSAPEADAPAGEGDGEAAQNDAAQDEAAPEEAQSDGGVLANVASAVEGRSIIYTVDLSIETDNVVAAANRAAAIATTSGGFVASEQVDGDRDAVLTLKVPADGHQQAVTELETLGDVTSRSRGTEDVTQEVVDTASRIESQRASIVRIRALLADATALTDVVSIESELATREADLDALLSRQQQLAGLTTMATVTLHLYEQGEAPPPQEEDDDRGFLAGLAGGWDAFVAVGGGFLTALGAVLPFAALAALVGVPAYRITRRRRGQAPAAAPATPAPPAA
ncbi:DUF4349 domain-containing protein [Jiangella alkaliphila]|uniref:DUF4349 domain-containing protein n=1 Tax=Jiangella alkaliphila TaxID=419479 RepID=A0A1H2L063_9ACTN|nr:DUF4349 domain-containing protein [Jiangella alkaliphila]SDU74134.1 protein of unknown function [Jiangella alkaliphila]